MNDDRLIDQRKSHLHAHLFLTSSVSIHRLFFKNRKMSGTYICYPTSKAYRKKHVSDIIMYNLSQTRSWALYQHEFKLQLSLSLLRYSAPQWTNWKMIHQLSWQYLLSRTHFFCPSLFSCFLTSLTVNKWLSQHVFYSDIFVCHSHLLIRLSVLKHLLLHHFVCIINVWYNHFFFTYSSMFSWACWIRQVHLHHHNSTERNSEYKHYFWCLSHLVRPPNNLYHVIMSAAVHRTSSLR
jgi:hypothetical protein